MKRPFLLYILLLLLLFPGLGAFAGGGALLLQPNGFLLGMDTSWLDHSPFKSYFIPGFILFTCVGLFSLLTFIGLLFKPRWTWANAINIYADRYWAWTYSLYSGIILITWITIQLIMTQYFWLQPVMIFNGLLIFIFTLFPSAMKYYKIESPSQSNYLPEETNRGHTQNEF